MPQRGTACKRFRQVFQQVFWQEFLASVLASVKPDRYGGWPLGAAPHSDQHAWRTAGGSAQLRAETVPGTGTASASALAWTAAKGDKALSELAQHVDVHANPVRQGRIGRWRGRRIKGGGHPRPSPALVRPEPLKVHRTFQSALRIGSLTLQALPKPPAVGVITVTASPA
jgi:hypothetical protein